MKTLGVLACLFFLVQTNYSQDVQFSNSNQSLIYLNPSFAGSNGGVRNQASFRNQWPTLSGSFVSYLNSLDFYLKPLRAGIALSYCSDDQSHGTLKTSAASITYAQYLTCEKSNVQIIPSFQASYGQKKLDLASLHFGDPVDPRRGFVWNDPVVPSPRTEYGDFSAGLLTRYKEVFYLGAYLFHFNQPDVGLMGESRLPSRFVLHASYSKHITDADYIQLFYKFQQQQNFTSSQIALNLILWKHFVTGLSYMYGDAVSINAGFRSEYISFLLGYDRVVSRLAGSTAGSWEAHLGFDLRKKDQRGKVNNFEN